MLRYSLAIALCLLFSFELGAQGRVSDKDVESMMRNLLQDAKAFRPVFDSDLRRSAIRKTSREKEAKNLSASFVAQIRTMLDRFKTTKKGDPELATVRSTAQQIDALVRTLKPGAQSEARWSRIQTELDNVSGAFGLGSIRAGENAQRTSSYPPKDPSAASGIPCVQGAGAERSKRLVDECLAVSPATHPPCNAQNSCPLIIDEIKRGCGLLDARSAPAFCSEYK